MFGRGRRATDGDGDLERRPADQGAGAPGGDSDAGPAAPSSPSSLDPLFLKLRELHARGILTDEELRLERQRIEVEHATDALGRYDELLTRMDRYEQLADRHDGGELSDDEYAWEKSSILMED